jgi:hypothetical protein
MVQVPFWTNWLKNQESAKDKLASEDMYKALEAKVDQLGKRLDGRQSNLEAEVTALQRAFLSWSGNENES